MGTRISIVATIDLNGGLGNGDDFFLKFSDMERVKSLIKGHPIIMGRITHELFLKSEREPLPSTANIVLSKSTEDIPEGTIANSLLGALQILHAIEQSEVFILGGATVFRDAFKVASRLCLRRIQAEYASADVFFPRYQEEFSRLISKEIHIDEKSGLKYEWTILERPRH